MVLNALFPVFAVILLGGVLRRTGFVANTFFFAADRLVYFILFPSMLFWKIGSGGSSGGVNPGLIAAALLAVLTIYALSTLYILAARVPAFQAGTFSQGCYRFNAYIGMAIALKAAGDEGAVLFAVTIGLVIPVINILSVGTLIWFSGKSVSPGEKGRYMVRALASNPLILACLAGIAFSATGIRLPGFADHTLSLLSSATLPLALLSVGSAFSVTRLSGRIGNAIVAAVFKLMLLPAAGYFFMVLFGVEDTAFRTGMIFFCLPASTAIYVLSSQMNSDTELASASIVISTLLSFFTLSAALLLTG